MALSNELKGGALLMKEPRTGLAMVVMVIMTTLCAAYLAFCVLFFLALRKDKSCRYEHICYLVVLKTQAGKGQVTEISAERMSSSRAA